jgi:lysophospholipase L1-like esterase
VGLVIFSHMKAKVFFLGATIAFALQSNLNAQTNVPAEAPAHVNKAILPVPRAGSAITNRQAEVLQRAKDASGTYDIEFIGDSITQGWEGAGKNVWADINAKYRVINFGVSGDRTENVLWRFDNGQLDGVKAKVAVVMIGTNNSNKNKDGSWTYTDNDILEGVTAIVNDIRKRQPETKVLLLGIFPRGKAFNEQRGRLLEINQALARLDDGKNVEFLDFGSQFIENDGSIATDIMKDALHPGEKGYRIWLAAMEPKLTELLAK